MFKSADPPLKWHAKLKTFLAVYWRGIVVLVTPTIFLFIILPPPVEMDVDTEKANTDIQERKQDDEEGSVEEDRFLTLKDRFTFFITNHWKGLVFVITPLILLPIPFPSFEAYQWCAYCLVVMAVFWVTECIPLPITSFLPVVIFPLAGVMDTEKTIKCYFNSVIFMFLGSLFLAAAVEQSGLHKRLAYCAIRVIGYSHYKLLFAMCFITMFMSMWITNTAATTMMVPINFALLRVFEEQNILKIYDTTESGDLEASDITTCYFCAATFSATIGGIGTLVGTATNLVFKGLMEKQYPKAPEYLTFPLFSAFAVPYMLIMEGLLYLSMILLYLGFLRPRSQTAKSSQMSEAAVQAAKATVLKNSKALGPFTFWEFMVSLLFGGAIFMFFARSPQVFPGWQDLIIKYFGITESGFITDATLAMSVSFLMLLLPKNLSLLKIFTADTHEQLPKGRIPAVLNWRKTDAELPYSFMFLLGGGFALSEAAKEENSNLNGRIGDILANLSGLSNAGIVFLITLFTIFLTNFASNVAVANVIVPIAMTMAEKTGRNPLQYCITSGFSASYCFMLPVGTPGNLVVQSAAKIPTKKMIIAGFIPTITTTLVTWAAMVLWAPVIWPDIKEGKPAWAVATTTTTAAP